MRHFATIGGDLDAGCKFVNCAKAPGERPAAIDGRCGGCVGFEPVHNCELFILHSSFYIVECIYAYYNESAFSTVQIWGQLRVAGWLAANQPATGSHPQIGTVEKALSL